MIAYPPSPALSICDSLDGVDLDALLDAQGSLSHFPTPPLKERAIVETAEVRDHEDEFAMNRYDENTAAFFATDATGQSIASPAQTTSIRDVIWRAQLPPEVLALAFNILAQHSLCVSRDRSVKSTDLLAVCAMTLAVSLTNDHPPTSAYWSHHICESAWTAREIDQSTLGMLIDLEWRLHELSSPRAIERTMEKLFASPPSHRATEVTTLDAPFTEMPSEQLGLVKVVCDDRTIRWAKGQLTPDDTPPCSAVEKRPQNLWLRLL